MKFEILKDRLEKIGFSADVIYDTLQIWSANKHVGSVDLDLNFYPGRDFITLNAKERNQVVYLILKQKGAIEYEAILEFEPEKG